ncbi:MAG: peptide-methionine (R)-S-oxide reductase, partial [Patescibacteria group bacterium]|nr:peptide-methionine (R)-S-oxide reductase [Patescibacteria group bacterium]
MDSKRRTDQTEEQWKQELSPEAYEALRKQGTEAAFSGKLLHEKRDGMYRCAACGNPLF